MRSIREIALKIKGLGAAVLGEGGVFIIVILAVTGAFGLGRLSVLTAPNRAILVQNGPLEGTSGAGGGLSIGGMYMGSKNNDIYYFPWCTDAAKIAPELRRWFTDEKAAQKAGYHAATNCKGMTVSNSGD